MEDTESTPAAPSALSQAAAERREAKAAALTAGAAAIADLDSKAEDDVDGITAASYQAIDSLREIVTVFGPRARESKGPRVQLEKAGFEEVGSYFLSTGLTRKELASAAKVSTSVIATVQNEKGDRWSTDTFAAKRALIDQWMVDHADEIATRQAADAAAQAAKDAKATAKAARAAAASSPKPASAPAPKAAASAKTASAKQAAGKPGRPSPARRAQNKAAKSSAPAAVPA